MFPAITDVNKHFTANISKIKIKNALNNNTSSRKHFPESTAASSLIEQDVIYCFYFLFYFYFKE